MPQHTPVGKQIPFPFIQGLDPRQQEEIYRDFEAVLAQLNPVSSLYDATIDGTLSASSPSTHVYKNLTDLVAGETNWTIDKTMTVAVKGTNRNTAFQDTSNITIPGPLVLIGPGFTGQYQDSPPIVTTPIKNLATWDLEGTVNGVHANIPITLVNIEVVNLAVSVLSKFFGSNVCLNAYQCQITGEGSQDQVVSCNGIGASTIVAVNCGFYAITPVGSSNAMNYLINCGWSIGKVGTLGSAITINGPSMIWTGFFAGVNGNNNIIQLVGGSFYWNVTIDSTTSYTGSVGSPGPATLALSTTSPCSMRLDGPFKTITVSAGAGDIFIDAQSCKSMTVSGNTNSNARQFKVGKIGGAGSAPVLDFTGPGEINALIGTANTDRVTLRGKDVHADLIMGSSSGDAAGILGLIACTDSEVLGSYTGGTAGSIAYALDASSNRNILILTGTNTGFTSAGVPTNAGTNNRIITETGDTFVTGTGAPSPSILNGEVAAVDSGIKTYGGGGTSVDAYGPAFLLMGG